MPYFLSNSMTEAITTEEQSVSGMKPIFTSFFSGASEPAAQTEERSGVGIMAMREAAPATVDACLRKRRRERAVAGLPDFVDSVIGLLHCVGSGKQKRRCRARSAKLRAHTRTPLFITWPGRRWPDRSGYLCKRHAIEKGRKRTTTRS